MYYVKKLCILKQLASGFAADGKKASALLTAEKFSGRLTLSLAMIGFAPLSAGRYRCLLCDEKGQTEVFDLPSPAGGVAKLTSPLSIEEGFCCAICFVQGTVTPVAFGKCGDKTYDLKKLCAALDETAATKPAPEPPARSLKDEKPQKIEEKTDNAESEDACQYDDELVATENYYEFDQGGTDDEHCQGTQETRSENVPGKDEDAQSLFRFTGGENRAANAGACYYEKVKNEIESLLEKHPTEDALEKSIPLSRWARIEFSKGKYYTVGVIRDEKGPRYICYGVPAASRGEPPAALKGYCSFLPASAFDADGKGYWMMFQDAETGQCVKIAQV